MLEDMSWLMIKARLMTGVYECGLEVFFSITLHYFSLLIFFLCLIVSCVEHYFQIKIGAQSLGLSLGVR